MYEHFEGATEVHSALVRGDMATARSAARWLATHEELSQLPPGSDGLLAEMRMYAQRVSAASDLASAAQATSQLGRVCGSCHAQYDVDPQFFLGTAAPRGRGTQAEMARHVWASERMWQGMVGPLDQAWREGARELREGWLDPQEVVSNPGDRAKVHELVRKVYEIGTRAEKAPEPRERAELYGSFLTTCIDCHRLTGAVIR
jgi:mono/diheme cytochrome c family protein